MTRAREVALTSLDRVLWPRTGFTKGAMLDYYERVAPVLLPHLADRPVTLARFPEGVDSPGWYQTECRGPSWMRTRVVGGRTGRPQSYCLIDDVEGLLWVANRGAIELHPLLSCGPEIDRPTGVLFDLDPGPPAGLSECCDVALLVREELEREGLRAWPKTTGSVGLHLHAPLAGESDFAETKDFARRLAARLAKAHPTLIVDRPARALRAGKVFVDWGQNERTRSAIAPYSLRAVEVPLVATPVTWEEVERDAATLVFSPAEVLERIDRHGDLFAPALGTVGT